MENQALCFLSHQEKLQLQLSLPSFLGSFLQFKPTTGLCPHSASWCCLLLETMFGLSATLQGENAHCFSLELCLGNWLGSVIHQK